MNTMVNTSLDRLNSLYIEILRVSSLLDSVCTLLLSWFNSLPFDITELAFTVIGLL